MSLGRAASFNTGSNTGRLDVVSPVRPSYMCNYSQKEMSVIVDNCRQINAANPCHDNKCNHNFFN